MLSPVDTFRAWRGAAEHLACDVVTESASRAHARVLVAKARRVSHSAIDFQIDFIQMSWTALSEIPRDYRTEMET
jgi:hypothetical protein